MDFLNAITFVADIFLADFKTILSAESVDTDKIFGSLVADNIVASDDSFIMDAFNLLSSSLAIDCSSMFSLLLCSDDRLSIFSAFSNPITSLVVLFSDALTVVNVKTDNSLSLSELCF